MIKKGYKSRVLWLAAAILWMALIFSFSDQKAEESSRVSGTLTWRLAESVNDAFRFDWDETVLSQYATALEHPVRKAAHMTEYAVLAWILLGNFSLYEKTRRRRYFYSEAASVLYAASDEFHQLFIKGRSCQFGDVCIDGLGAFLGLLFAFGAAFIAARIKDK